MGYLEEGDLDELLTAASAVGDDTLQKQKARGYVVPESFTHGTSEQRKGWFYKGYEKRTIQGGDTFNSKTPVRYFYSRLCYNGTKKKIAIKGVSVKMAVPFTIMHGCGNDYIYINCFEHTIDDPIKLSQQI